MAQTGTEKKKKKWKTASLSFLHNCIYWKKICLFTCPLIFSYYAREQWLAYHSLRNPDLVCSSAVQDGVLTSAPSCHDFWRLPAGLWPDLALETRPHAERGVLRNMSQELSQDLKIISQMEIMCLWAESVVRKQAHEGCDVIRSQVVSGPRTMSDTSYIGQDCA
jgi:hypothetical protein